MRASRVGVVALATVLSAVAFAAPAEAKSDVQLFVNPTTVSAGHALHARVEGGSDSIGAYSMVCLERRWPRRWRTIQCSRPVANVDADAVLHVTWHPTRRGTIPLRGQLFSTDAKGGHQVAEQLTSVTRVHVDA